MMLKGLDDCGRTLTRLRIYLNRRKINIWIRVFISSLLLIFLFHKLNLSALKLIDESILVYFIFSLPIPAICIFIMAIRWKILIKSTLDIKINIIDLYKFYLMGNFFSLFLPGLIGGDATRIYNSKEKYNISFKYATAFVFIERIIGLVGVILIFSFGSMLVSDPQLIMKLHKINYFLIFIILIITIFKNRLVKDRVLLIDNEIIFISIILSIISQFGDIMIVKLFSDYFNLGITITHLMVIMPIIYIVSNLPISLGGLGVREGAMVASFSLFGFNASASVFISLLLYFTKVFIGLIGMAVYIKRES